MDKQEIKQAQSPQLPVSEQEIQIQAPSLLEKISAQKRKIFIGLGSFLGVLILTGAAFGIYKYAQRQIPIEPTEGPTPTLIATPTPDETADWETYTNEEYKFSFSYPKNYQLKALSSLEKSFFINEPILLRLELTQDIYQNIGQYPAIVLNVVKTEKTIEQVLDYIKELNKITLEDLKNPESLYYTQSPPKINSVESIKIGNLETTKVERYLGPGGPNPNVLEYYLAFPPYILVFSANFGTYNPDVGQDGTEERETLSRIMTTFKFLEGAGWQTYSFKAGKEASYGLSYPYEWNLDVVYCSEEQCGGEANEYVQIVKISKDGYVFHLYSPIGFGMDFCFYPESTPYPPFYEGEGGHDFGTFKDYEKIESQYGGYIRGKTSVLGELDGEEKYYLGVCNKEEPVEHILEGVFVNYFLPSASYNEEKVVVMDDILKSLHKVD